MSGENVKKSSKRLKNAPREDMPLNELDAIAQQTREEMIAENQRNHSELLQQLAELVQQQSERQEQQNEQQSQRIERLAQQNEQQHKRTSLLLQDYAKSLSDVINRQAQMPSSQDMAELQQSLDAFETLFSEHMNSSSSG